MFRWRKITSWAGRVVPAPVRTATNFLRPLPDFLIIGAGKSGTTSLHNYLVQHPKIIGGREKEIQFFDQHYSKGPNAYRAHFPLLRGRDGLHRRGDASPSYLAHPGVPERIKSLMPGVRMIALLRDPTERALSQYFHWVRMRRETLPLREAIEKDESRGGIEPGGPVQDTVYEDRENPPFLYLRKGHYLEQIERYWKLFPRENLLILRSEDFFARPEEHLKEICRFIGVDDSFEWRDLRPHNVGDNKTDVPGDVRAMLREYFAPHNRRLEDALGRKMGWD